MSATPLPLLRRLTIEGRNDIAAIEGLISAVAGVIAATGGTMALAGGDLFGLSPRGRALLLTDMYEAGEVIFGWRDGRDGVVANVALERVEATAGETRRIGWRASVYAEEEAGHVLRGAFIEGDLKSLGRRILGASNDGLETIPAPGAALIAFLRDAD